MRLAEWLAPRGLRFNEDKTQIVHLGEQGFDFLGFNVRRYGSKLLIKPSKAAIRRLRQRLAFEMRVLRGSNAVAVIARFNPIIKGWAAYYRGVVSSKVFHTLDYQMWKLTYKWATWQHNNKPKRWIVEHYFGKRNKFRNDRWVFGDPASDAYLVKFSWTDIVRHVMVTGAASPDDPALADYWAERRRKVKPPLDNYTLRLLARQDARCPLCGDHLLTADQPPQSPHDWERWWQQVTRQAIAADYLVHHGRPGRPDNDQTRLVHASCHRGLRARRRGTPAQLNLHALAACLSRMPRRVARTVLRGPRRSNPPGLPGGRQGPADRDHDQRHPRFRDRETADQSARTAGDRLHRQPSPAAASNDSATTRSAAPTPSPPSPRRSSPTPAPASPGCASATNAPTHCYTHCSCSGCYPNGFTNRDLRAIAPLRGLDPRTVTAGQMTYDLRRLKTRA